MNAVVYNGKNKVAVEEVSDPKLEAPGDAIIRITTAAICGSGPHMYNKRSTAEPGMVFGHENQGLVEEVGEGVVSVKQGDRVVLPFNISAAFVSTVPRVSRMLA
jgi:glutathione-independent formaldehyde dehydrogenase